MEPQHGVPGHYRPTQPTQVECMSSLCSLWSCPSTSHVNSKQTPYPKTRKFGERKNKWIRKFGKKWIRKFGKKQVDQKVWKKTSGSESLEKKQVDQKKIP